MAGPKGPEAAPGAEAGDALLGRSTAGARILLVRGFVLRAISVATNLALVALVAPTDLGLLVVVRSAFGVFQFAADLGFELAIIRRRHDPTREELAAVTGLRMTVLAGGVLAAVAVPQVRTVFGLIPSELGGWMSLALASLLITPLQFGGKIALERGLRFRRLSVIEVYGILLQNVTLVLFALGGRFPEGVFVSQIGASLYYTIVLRRVHRGPRPSLALRALRPLWGESLQFSVALLLHVAQQSLTPILIGKMFGLSIAGVWGFAQRAGQFLQVALEGFWRASVPAAGRLGDSAAALQRFSTAILRDAAALTYPAAALLYALVPLVGVWFARWAEAVEVAQTYVVGLGVLGVVYAALWPVAVARQGAGVAARAQVLELGAAWLGLAGFAALGATNVAVPIMVAFALAVAYLVGVTDRTVRPAFAAALRGPLVVLVASLFLGWLCRVLGGDVVLAAAAAAALPAVALLGALRRDRRVSPA